MKLEDICNMWAIDAEIDQTKLTQESLKCDRLHAKYSRIQVMENVTLAEMKADYNKLILDTYIFYTEGAKTTKDIARAPKGAILKSEAEKYILGDQAVVEASKKLAIQQEKCNLLKEIIYKLSRRGYDIHNAIDHMKYISGS